MAIKLNFKINEDLLVVHTLVSAGDSFFSSPKNKKEIIAFQNFAWKLDKSCYEILLGRVNFLNLVEGGVGKDAKRIPDFLTKLKKSSQFNKIFSQVHDYLDFCKNQWAKNYDFSFSFIKETTGLRLDKNFDVFITHPSLRNGTYLGKNKIIWGHNEDWPNYSTVYLWHEILHSYFGLPTLEHVVVELITDEELRSRLNGEKYPPFAGHKNISELKAKILPFWMDYLKEEKKNIKDFLKFLKRKF